MTVYNAFGCHSSDTALVSTRPCCDVFVPTAFTPNGDGKNDWFLPVLQPGQRLLDFTVYDRWGKQVYQSSGQNQGWDGAYQNGQAAANATYMYYMLYTCPNSETQSKKGDVTLIR